MFIVAIDGPAGTGKGTVTKIIAEKMGLVNIDTGAMYRCVTLDCINKNIDISNEKEMQKILDNIDIQLVHNGGTQSVILNGKDVSREIRTPEVDSLVSAVSALKIVRDKITPLQRKMGEETNVIMEGRDIGTDVFQNADVKIFLDCSVEEMANRRYKQNIAKGINESYENILEAIKKRNKFDAEREIAPFVKADDAVLIDTTNLTIEEVVTKIENLINSKRGKKDA